MTGNHKTGLHAMQYKTIDGLQIRFATSDSKKGDPILLLSPLPESILAFLPTWDMFAELGPVRSGGSSTVRSIRGSCADARTPEKVGEFVRSHHGSVRHRETPRDRTGHWNAGMSVRRGQSPWRVQEPRHRERSDGSHRHSWRPRSHRECSVARAVQGSYRRTVRACGSSRHEDVQATG